MVELAVDMVARSRRYVVPHQLREGDVKRLDWVSELACLLGRHEKCMQNVSQAAGLMGARSRGMVFPMETAPTHPCPSRPALRPNCQIYPLPFASQCGAWLQRPMEQAIGIDTSQASMSCVGRLPLAGAGPAVADVPQSNSPSIIPPTNTTILNSPRCACNRYSR